MAISPDGDVYVARRFLGQGVYTLDPELTLAPVELLDAGDIGGILRIWIENEIPTATWVAGGFNVPAGIVFEPDGRLLVAEYATGEVWRLELLATDLHNNPFDGSPPEQKDGADHRTRVTTLSPGILSIALDPRGHFFVSNGQDGSVTKIYSYGYKREVCQGGLIMPGGLALHTNGDNTELIVSSWLGCVQVINPNTCELVECYDYRDIGAKPVNSIRYHGEVVVADRGTGTVLWIAHDGQACH